MITAHSITKSFGKIDVLRGVSLQVEAGTIHGFIGPNGAGKSTFLKSLVGVVTPTSGSITIDGLDAVRQSLQVRRRVGYAPAETSLYHRLRCSELLDFSIKYHPNADFARGMQLLQTFGVPHARKVGALSHGMKRKLILIQAIVSNAPLLILDEPMEALDPEARRDMEQLLREESESGRTIFLSSHDLFSTQRLCSRVTFLHRGRVLRDGLVAELLSGRSGRLQVQFEQDQEVTALPCGDGLTWSGGGSIWQLRFDKPLPEVLQMLAALPVIGIRDDGSLEDLFDRLYERSDGDAA
jgi:ABC-2 type transport system ATP-binding protein